MKIKDDTINFSSGRKAYAHRGIIGLSPKAEDGWQVSEGYDGGFWNDGPKWGDPSERLTVDDLRELADHMIALWGQFKDDLK